MDTLIDRSVSIMNKHTDDLLDAVKNIAEIIYYEMSLKEQDIWLNDIMAKGIWLPDPKDIE